MDSGLRCSEIFRKCLTWVEPESKRVRQEPGMHTYAKIISAIIDWFNS